MIKNKIKLESIIKERVGHFVLDNDCPIEIAEQMIIEFTQYLGKIKEQVKANAEAQKQEKPSEVVPQEEPKE